MFAEFMRRLSSLPSVVHLSTSSRPRPLPSHRAGTSAANPPTILRALAPFGVLRRVDEAYCVRPQLQPVRIDRDLALRAEDDLLTPQLVLDVLAVVEETMAEGVAEDSVPCG